MDSPASTGSHARWRAALAVVALTACAVAAPGIPAGQDPHADATLSADVRRAAHVERNVRYGSHDAAVLDVYRASGPRRTGVPGVLVAHGGGWRFGDKRRTADVARALARAGFVAFNVNYSLATPSRPGFPTQLRELRAALRWIRRHAARYGVEPRKLGALGSSAGAHLVTLAGSSGTGARTDPPLLRAVVAWSGPFDLASLDQPALVPAVTSLLGCRPPGCLRRTAAASPVTHVTEGDPPMLIVSSESELVPIEQARGMAAQLRAAAVPHRLLVLAGTAHGIEYADSALPPSVAFLRRQLR